MCNFVILLVSHLTKGTCCVYIFMNKSKGQATVVGLAWLPVVCEGWYLNLASIWIKELKRGHENITACQSTYVQSELYFWSYLQIASGDQIIIHVLLKENFHIVF